MMTDFRALCAELLDWAEVTAAHYIQLPAVMLRARAALADEPAAPEGRDPAAVTKQPSDAEQVLRLAAIIREVDGNHSKGAAALAESILDHPGFRVVLASWETSNLTQTKLSPAAGEVVGLVKMLKGIAYWRLHGTDKPTPFDIRQAARLTRAAELLQRLSPPQPLANGEVGKPVAWMCPAEPYFDGNKWHDQWQVTLDQRLAEYWARPGKPTPLFTRAAELLQRQVLVPVSVSERPWEREGWCDAEGRCWLGSDALDGCTPTWLYGSPAWAERFPNVHRVLLPAHALPLPEVGE